MTFASWGGSTKSCPSGCFRKIILETAVSHGEHREHGVKTKTYGKETDHLAGETMISPNALFLLFFPRAPRGQLLFIG